ncbi:Pantothenate synthetase [Dirofilaria immitis]
MQLHQSTSDSGDYGTRNNYFFLRLLGQNIINRRKKNENGPGYIKYTSSKEDDESNPTGKATTYQCGITTKEIGAKLIALADAFDAEFFGNLNISKEQYRISVSSVSERFLSSTIQLLQKWTKIRQK